MQDRAQEADPVAYDEKLAERIRRLLAGRAYVREQEMFGGIGFMVGGNMCWGVYGTDLLLRLSPEALDVALADANTRPMEMGGRTMRGLASRLGPRDQDCPAADVSGSAPRRRTAIRPRASSPR